MNYSTTLADTTNPARMDNTQPGALELNMPGENHNLFATVNDLAIQRDLRIGIHYAGHSVATPEWLHTNYDHATIDLILAYEASPTTINSDRRSLEWYFYLSPEDRDGQSLWNLNTRHVPSSFRDADYPTWAFNDHIDEYSDPLGTTWDVGYIADRIVYMPFTVVELNYPNQRACLQSMLTDAIRLAQQDDVMESHRQAARNRLVETLADAIESQQSGRLEELMQQVERNTREMNEYRDLADRAEANLRDIRPQYEAVRRQRIDPALTDASRLNGIIEQIEQLPDVARVSPATSAMEHIVVHTDLIEMSCRADGRTYTTEAGRFGLHLNFSQPSIRITNEPEYMIDGYEHPHVSSGTFCLGEVRHLVLSIMKEFDFPTAVAVIIDQLRTVNPSDAYFPRWYEFFNGDLDHIYGDAAYEDDDDPDEF